MSFQFQPVQLATNSADSEGRLVFRDGILVAVLTLLSDQHGADAGRWFLETGFGRAGDRFAPLFDDLDSATVWLESGDHLIVSLRKSDVMAR